MGDYPRSDLHVLDLRLCSMVIANVRWNLDCERIRVRIGKFPQEMADFLIDETADSPMFAGIPAYLLNWDELDAIVRATESLPLADQREWLPSPEFLAGDITICTGEIRQRLSATEAERWSRAAYQFSDELQQSQLPLAAGIEIVQEWTDFIRHYKKALGSLDLLPRPDGSFPTPANTEPFVSTVSGADDLDVVYVEKLLKAIQEHPDGLKAKVSDVIAIVGMNNQKGRDLLRQLQEDGKFDGFGRNRPRRYSKSR